MPVPVKRPRRQSRPGLLVGIVGDASGALSVWLPVVAWAAVIFAFSSIPSLGTGLGLWDTFLRKGAHVTEYAILGALLLRALGREPLALAAGIAYAVTDELHQHFVQGRHASPLDVLVDAAGIVLGIYLFRRLRETRLVSDTGQKPMRAVAIELDGVLGDTRGLWRDWLEDAARRFRSIAPLDPAELSEDRGEAARELDRWAQAGVGDWRAALARFAEDRAPVYLRPDADVSAALRALAADGVRLGVFTDAPEELALVAVAQLGAARRVEALEAGAGALDRLLARFGPGTEVVRDVMGLRLQSGA